MPLSPRLAHKASVIQAKLKRKCALFQSSMYSEDSLTIKKKANLFFMNI